MLRDRASWRSDSQNNGNSRCELRESERLVDFNRKNDHCMVPNRHMQDKSLGQWVEKQRSLSTKDAMPQDRKDLLDELGFVWKVEKADEWGSKWNK
jgi:hypothetical protein